MNGGKKMKYWRKPLDHDKWKRPKGEIHIIADRCKGCGFCIEFCPNDVLIESKNFNKKGYHPPEAKDPDNCICCRLCELICPDFAIFVLGEECTDNTKGDIGAESSAEKTQKEVENA